MFLVTTADQRFWKASENVLFLGEWCKIYSQRHIWSKVNHQLLPYHWDDREKIYQDFLYLDQVYERCLLLLSDKLNKFHGVSHSTRYWRILIGPWLNHFIAIFYDRYRSILSAAETKNISNTWVPSWKSSDCIPLDFQSFKLFYVEDEYNLYLYSWLINALGGIPFEVKKDTPPLNLKGGFPTVCGHLSKTLISSRNSLFSLGFFKNLFKKNFGFYSKLIPGSLNKIIFISSYLRKWDLVRLQLSLGQAPIPYSPLILAKKTVADLDPRKALLFDLENGQFESLLSKIIPTQIPTVYLEGYSDIRKRALKAYPKQPKLIYTTNALYSDEGFKIWAAEKLENDTKLVGSQHGGHYGSSLWSSNERHETEVSDKYFTWGWADKTKPKEISIPAAQLIGGKNRIKTNPSGGILWTVMSVPRYAYWMHSFPTGPQFLHYLADQESFVKTVNPEVHDLLTLRLFPHSYGWNEEKRWKDIDPSLKLYRGRKTFFQQVSESRLSVATINSTTFLECFAANFPTIIFWDPKFFELRNSAKHFYDDLRRVGILHDTPESAAVKVNEIFLDPMAWWMSTKIQKSKDNFCFRFARTNDDWVETWKKELVKIASKNKT